MCPEDAQVKPWLPGGGLDVTGKQPAASGVAEATTQAACPVLTAGG